jgi:hypothetical protein
MQPRPLLCWLNGPYFPGDSVFALLGKKEVHLSFKLPMKRTPQIPQFGHIITKVTAPARAFGSKDRALANLPSFGRFKKSSRSFIGYHSKP